MFISYARENSADADRLQKALESGGLRVWRDTANLWPGQDWREEIRRAIADSAIAFLACFSRANTGARARYFNQELNLAIDQLAMRKPEYPWLIPVRFDDSPVPDLPIGGGRVLGQLQRSDLFGDQAEANLNRLVTGARHILGGHDIRVNLGPAPEPAPQPGLSSEFARYRAGIDQLGQLINPGDPGYLEFEEHCRELAGQLNAAEATSESDEVRSNRNKTIYALDQLALAAAGKSFRELCRLGFSYADWEAAEPSIASALHYAEFSSITDDHSRSFVGRDKLMEQIYDTVNDGPERSGYTVITGEPGIGKSAVIAQLVRSERWVHHYIGGYLRTGEQILKSLCAQLIQAYDLSYNKPLFSHQEPCRALNELLAAATRSRRNWPVVVAIDGFDESDDLQRGSLTLPPSLPSGAFIVVTRQTQGVGGHVFAHRIQPVELKNDDANKLDVGGYISRFIDREGDKMRAAVAEFGLTEAEFTDQLVVSGDGNFMYVTAILPDILSRRITPASVNDSVLPEKLAGYYACHWERMQKLAGKDKFDSLFIPVVELLAGQVARRGPVTVNWLAKHSGLQRRDIALVLETWSQFFVQKDGLVRFYHSSFRDFLAKTLGLEV